MNLLFSINRTFIPLLPLELERILLLPDQDILTTLYGDHVKSLDSLRYDLGDRVLAFHAC